MNQIVAFLGSKYVHATAVALAAAAPVFFTAIGGSEPWLLQLVLAAAAGGTLASVASKL